MELRAGWCTLPAEGTLRLDESLQRPEALPAIGQRLCEAALAAGVRLEMVTGPEDHPRLVVRTRRTSKAPSGPDGYALEIGELVDISYQEEGGLRAAVATLRQLLRQHGRRLPKLTITDFADFPRRGVMLDVSRGRVPNLQTLFDLVDHLADFKINEFQLYTEHTFAYRNYEPVWRGWGPLTGDDILRLDARCRELGIDLVPNQNSFGHLRYWLEHPPIKRLAEVQEPYEGTGGDFLRYPTTLAPNHPGTLPFLRELYDELLPHFSSKRFNVGCDETWDLGRGFSRQLCENKGKGRVYLDFLKRIQREVSSRGRRMMFWGDIILHHPELIAELPLDVIALNWGYEANHPFEEEAATFAKSKVPFYVCPGTSTWMTLIGRHDNAFANLRAAAAAGRRYGASGFLNTDWGDGGHPQPLAVSFALFLAGAALSWCGDSYAEKLLPSVLSRDVFRDPTGRAAAAALALGQAHRKFKYSAPNVTPYGTVVAAPPPELRELVCRDGLKYYARIPGARVQAALDEVERHRATLAAARPEGDHATILVRELDLAARMAAESCHIMLWQQDLASGRAREASKRARSGITRLRTLEREFNAYWPARNKGTTEHCSAFLAWRIGDYRNGVLHFPPAVAERTGKPAAPIRPRVLQRSR